MAGYTNTHSSTGTPGLVSQDANRLQSLTVKTPNGRSSPKDIAADENSPVRLSLTGVEAFKERRRRRRVMLQPMYTAAIVRVLSARGEPLEGHVVNLSETGMVVEVDHKIGTGQPVTVEFCVAGLGRPKGESWPMHAVAAEVVRIDDLADFPQGPYKIAMRFVRISTMAQAQIARFIAMQPAAVDA